MYQAAADLLGVQLQVLEVRDAGEIGLAFQTMARSGAQAVILAQDPLFGVQRQRIATLALRTRLPTISGETGFAEAGGLMTYGASIRDNFRRAAAYVDKILKGARAGRPSYRAADQVRLDRQFEDRQDGWPCAPAVNLGAGRSGIWSDGPPLPANPAVERRRFARCSARP